jgi:hypothetical protein
LPPGDAHQHNGRMESRQPDDAPRMVDHTASHVFISYARDGARGQRLAVALQRALEARGIACWRDETDTEGGRSWPSHIEEHLRTARAMVCVVSAAAHEQERWVRRELTFALRPDIAVPIVPVLAEPGVERPLEINHLQPVDMRAGLTGEALEQLVRGLGEVAPPTRRVEVAYLQGLLHRQGLERAARCYEPLSGDEHPLITLGRVSAEEMNPAMALIAERFGGQERGAPRHVEDVATAIAHTQRLAVLGEPGAGKTHALKRVAAQLATDALTDARKPIPLFVPLREWLAPPVTPADGGEAEADLDAFLASRLDPLGEGWKRLLEEGRAAVLLDGLNELPSAHRKAKAKAIRRLCDDRRLPLVVASCRRNDFVDELHLTLDTLEILPLEEPRIRGFCKRYLRAVDEANGEASGETLFWLLAGGEHVRSAFETAERNGVSFEQFWGLPVADPIAVPEADYELRWAMQTGERAKSDPRSLLALSRNPYLLWMLIELHLQRGQKPSLPRNRAQLFEVFVAILVKREEENHRRLTKRGDTPGVDHPGRPGLEDALGQFAWALQSQAGSAEKVQLAMPWADAEEYFTPHQRRLALDANLLEADDTVRFSHQLLQEYFVALGMQTRITRGTLDAADLWPRDTWWERSGWEEAAVFLAGLNEQDPALVIDWLRDAQPAVLQAVPRGERLRAAHGRAAGGSEGSLAATYRSRT